MYLNKQCWISNNFPSLPWLEDSPCEKFCGYAIAAVWKADKFGVLMDGNIDEQQVESQSCDLVVSVERIGSWESFWMNHAWTSEIGKK